MPPDDETLRPLEVAHGKKHAQSLPDAELDEAARCAGAHARHALGQGRRIRRRAHGDKHVGKGRHPLHGKKRPVGMRAVAIKRHTRPSPHAHVKPRLSPPPRPTPWTPFTNARKHLHAPPLPPPPPFVAYLHLYEAQQLLRLLLRLARFLGRLLCLRCVAPAPARTAPRGSRLVLLLLGLDRCPCVAALRGRGRSMAQRALPLMHWLLLGQACDWRC
jgi:hypothetical protein